MSTLAWKTEKELKQEIKNKGDQFFFCMENMKISQRRWKNEKCWRPPGYKWGKENYEKSEQEFRRHFSTWNVHKKCMLKCSKKCAARAKLFFGSLDLLIFCRSRSCRRLALHFLIVSVNYKYINDSFAFSPGQIYILIFTWSVNHWMIGSGILSLCVVAPEEIFRPAECTKASIKRATKKRVLPTTSNMNLCCNTGLMWLVKLVTSLCV